MKKLKGECALYVICLLGSVQAEPSHGFSTADGARQGIVQGEDVKGYPQNVRGQWSSRMEHAAPFLYLLIFKRDVCHEARKNLNREEERRVAWHFLPYIYFQKGSDSSNEVSTSLPDSHQEEWLLWTLPSLQMFPLRGHTNSWNICFPEKNAIMEVFL